MAKSYELAEFGQLLTYDTTSNVTSIQSAISVGNSTVDIVINSTAIAIGNSTTNTNIGNTSMSFGDLSGNYYVNTSSLFFGNSITNVTINSTAVFVDGGRLTGTNLYATYAWLNNHTFTSNSPTSNATSGTIEVVGGVGVYGNIYTAGVVGYSNTANVSVVYQVYNPTTDSLDTVFG